MAYELYFRARQHAGMDEARFLYYFHHRPHYRVQDGQAWYINEATGVDFCFTLTPLPDALVPHGNHYPVVLHISYLRPDYLIQEAEPEVTAFVRYFDLQVADPQAGGMGEGEYDPIALVNGWNVGNELAHVAMQQGGGDTPCHLPSLLLRRIWRWNYRRAERQARLASTVLVPEIRLLQRNGEVLSIAEWPDGCAAIIPPVDWLLIPRQQLAPRRWWHKVPDCTLVEWKRMAPLLQLHGIYEADGGISLSYCQPPQSISRMIRRLKPCALEGRWLKPGEVLTRELVLAAPVTHGDEVVARSVSFPNKIKKSAKSIIYNSLKILTIFYLIDFVENILRGILIADRVPC